MNKLEQILTVYLNELILILEWDAVPKCRVHTIFMVALLRNTNETFWLHSFVDNMGDLDFIFVAQQVIFKSDVRSDLAPL